MLLLVMLSVPVAVEDRLAFQEAVDLRYARMDVCMCVTDRPMVGDNRWSSEAHFITRTACWLPKALSGTGASKTVLYNMYLV